MLDTPTAAPGARVLAAVRMRLGAARIPARAATAVAAAMAAAGAGPDDLTDEALAELGRKAHDLIRANASPETMADELAAMLEALTTADSEVSPAPVSTDATAILDLVAMHGGTVETARQFIADRTPLSGVIAHYRQKGVPVTKHKTGPAMDRFGRSTGPTMIERLADGLAARIDPRHQPTIGAEFARASLGEIAMHSARAAGLRPRDVLDALRPRMASGAGHTTSDYPLATTTAGGLELVIGRAIADAPCDLMRAAHELQAGNYLAGNVLSLSASAVPEEIGEAGEIKHTTIDERGEAKPVPRDFGAIYRLSNTAVVNDRIGLLQDMAKPMQRGAREKQRQMLIEPLTANAGLGQTLADGLPVFHESHGNLAPAPEHLFEASLHTARLALRSQRGPHGEHLNIQPWALVVPPALETTAQKLIATITPAATDNVNPFTGLELIVEVGLPDPEGWYLIGDPTRFDGLAYSYLDGQKAPRVEAKPGWEWLGIEYRLVWAFDAKFVDHRSWYYNPGA